MGKSCPSVPKCVPFGPMTPAELARIATARELARTGAARRIRLTAGLSLSEFSEAIGAAPSAISRWESGQRTPRPRVALRYAAVLETLQQVARR